MLVGRFEQIEAAAEFGRRQFRAHPFDVVCDLRAIGTGTLGNSVADCPVADLIVILDEPQEAMLG